MKFLGYLARGFVLLGRGAAIGLGFSLPISTAIDNLLLAVVVACFVLGGDYRARLSFIAKNPALLAPLALFGVLALGTLYSAAAPGEAGGFLYKYLELLLIPVIAAFFREPSTRRAAIHAFAGAIVLTVLLSFALHVSVLARSPLLLQDESFSVPFKHSLTHAILVGFGAFVFVQLALAARSAVARWAWFGMAAAAVANMTLLVPGRTGFVVLGVLALYTGYALWRWRGLVAIAVASVLMASLAYRISDRFHDRVARALEEYSAQRADVPAGATSSVAIRMEFYRNSLAIVRDHPFVGVGTGGFRQAYADRVRGTGMTPTSNPHNEYLLLAVQIGCGGVLVLIFVLWAQWTSAPRLASPPETRIARGLVLVIGVGGLFNSLLIDHTEGLLYAWLTAVLYGGLQSPKP
jgi:hypothetical protein